MQGSGIHKKQCLKLTALCSTSQLEKNKVAVEMITKGKYFFCLFVYVITYLP